MKILSDKNYIILEAQAASFKSEKNKYNILENKYKNLGKEYLFEKNITERYKKNIDKRYEDLQKEHDITKNNFEEYKKTIERKLDSLFEKECSLLDELNKYKEYYKKAITEGFLPEIGDWVLKIFQLRINQTLSSSSKDITYLGSGTDEFGLYFLYSAVVWESSKIDLSKTTL